MFDDTNRAKEEDDDLLCLNKTVRPLEPNNLNDINSVRAAMEKVGDYKGVSPTFYERSFMDKPLEKSIKSYQEKNGLEADGILNPKGETEKSINKTFRSLKEKWDTAKGMYNNYKEMKRLGWKNADDFFHCKANFEAAQKSEESEKFAKFLGDKKENFDYPINRFFKNLSASEAMEDKKHDLEVNAYGLEQGRKERLSPAGRTAKQVCKEKYNKNRLLNDY